MKKKPNLKNMAAERSNLKCKGRILLIINIHIWIRNIGDIQPRHTQYIAHNSKAHITRQGIKIDHYITIVYFQFLLLVTYWYDAKTKLDSDD